MPCRDSPQQIDSFSVYPPLSLTRPRSTLQARTKARTLASEPTEQQTLPSLERHASRPSLSLVTDVQQAEFSAINSSVIDSAPLRCLMPNMLRCPVLL